MRYRFLLSQIVDADTVFSAKVCGAGHTRHGIRRLCFLVAFTASLLAGCTTHHPLPPPARPDVDVELVDTPFFPQQQYQCGPAALATMLHASGIATHPNDLAPLLYLPGRQGSLQLEIIASIRNSHRIPYILAPEISAIAAELQEGRPVLVLQNLGLKFLPAYHYAVVVGILPDDKIVLRSGTTKRLVLDLAEFLNSWDKAERWAVIVLRPGELPADIDITKYLEIIAGIEATGNAQLAKEGYQTLLDRYPGQSTARFGLANSLYAQKNFLEAARIYRGLLESDPEHAAAANNLAETLANLHCFSQALALLDTFLRQHNPPSNITAILAATRTEIAKRGRTEKNRATACRKLTR